MAFPAPVGCTNQLLGCTKQLTLRDCRPLPRVRWLQQPTSTGLSPGRRFLSTSRRLLVENLVENYALQTKGDLASDAFRHAAKLRAAGGHLKINSKRAGQTPINRKLTACRRSKKSRDLVSKAQTRANLYPYPFHLLILILEALRGLCAECTYLGRFDRFGRPMLVARGHDSSTSKTGKMILLGKSAGCNAE